MAIKQGAVISSRNEAGGEESGKIVVLCMILIVLALL